MTVFYARFFKRSVEAVRFASMCVVGIVYAYNWDLTYVPFTASRQELVT